MAARGDGDDDDVSQQAWREVMRDLVTLDRTVAELTVGDSGLLPVQADLLLRLSRLPGRRSPMNALAAQLRVSGSSLTKLVDRLSEQALARRDASPSDRRVVYVALTEAGARQAEQLAQRLAAAVRARVLAVPGVDVVGLADVARRLA